MRVGLRMLVDGALGLIGLALFLYGDFIANRAARLVGFVIITVCVVAAAIMAAFRDDGHHD